MKKTVNKMRRLAPVLKVRERQVQEQAQMLAEVENRRAAVARDLHESQKAYLDGIAELNRIRTSDLRVNLATLEASVDGLKDKWHKLYYELSKLDKQQALLRGQMQEAQMNLKAVELLNEKYKSRFAKELDKAEQKDLDQVAIRRHVNGGGLAKRGDTE